MANFPTFAFACSLKTINNLSHFLPPVRSGPTKKSRAEYSSGEILNSKQTMEYHQATGQLSVSFRNMSLKKIKRAEKKGTESVMDEKFALLFWSEFPIANGEHSYQVHYSHEQDYNVDIQVFYEYFMKMLQFQ